MLLGQAKISFLLSEWGAGTCLWAIAPNAEVGEQPPQQLCSHFCFILPLFLLPLEVCVFLSGFVSVIFSMRNLSFSQSHDLWET